jgi:rod shape-determining protein MreC
MRDSGRVRTALALLLALALTFLVIGIRSGEDGVVSSARSALLSITGPIQSGATSLGSSIKSIGKNLSRITSRDVEYDALQKENDQLRFQLSQTNDLRRRSVQLDQLLRIVPPDKYKVVPAQVIAIGGSNDFSFTITIDAGYKDGVRTNTSVVSGTGLVGRVIRTGKDFAVVSLLVDAKVKVGARLQGTAEIGFISGTGNLNELKLSLLDPYVQIPVGTKVVSWGSETGKPYTPGILIGRVSKVEGAAGQLNRVATVVPSADISNLDIVGVVIASKRSAIRDALTENLD